MVFGVQSSLFRHMKLFQRRPWKFQASDQIQCNPKKATLRLEDSGQGFMSRRDAAANHLRRDAHTRSARCNRIEQSSSNSFGLPLELRLSYQSEQGAVAWGDTSGSPDKGWAQRHFPKSTLQTHDRSLVCPTSCAAVRRLSSGVIGGYRGAQCARSSRIPKIRDLPTVNLLVPSVQGYRSWS